MNTTLRWFLTFVFAARICAAALGADRPTRVPADLIDRFDAKARPSKEVAGLGIAWTLRDGRLLVNRVLPGSPAEKSGKLHQGDWLIAVGQGSDPPVDTKHMSISQVVPLIRGPKGTLIMLTIVPAGKTEAGADAAIVVPLARGVIKELNVFGDGQLLTPGTFAPAFEGILLRGGGKYELSRSRGKIVVVEFWASWCAPCLKLLDPYQDLRKRHPEWKNRVEFVAVGVDEDRQKAVRLIDDRGGRWRDLTIVWSGLSVLKTFHASALPCVYVLDRRGKVVARPDGEDLVVTIKTALDESGSKK